MNYQWMLLRCLFITFLMSVNSLWAQEAQPIENNAEVEMQVQRLSEELRCLVCQNQTLADSHSELAQDLKREIREMALKGTKDQAIIDFLAARYGDFVRYRPPLKTSTFLLWFGPFVLFFAGGIGLILMLLRRQKISEDTPLNEEEASLLRVLLEKESS